MSLQNMETGQPAPAREQLHNLNQQSKQELENSLLKEVLAEYTEQWKDLKREQNSFYLVCAFAIDLRLPTLETVWSPYRDRNRFFDTLHHLNTGQRCCRFHR